MLAYTINELDDRLLSTHSVIQYKFITKLYVKGIVGSERHIDSVHSGTYIQIVTYNQADQSFNVADYQKWDTKIL